MKAINIQSSKEFEAHKPDKYTDKIMPCDYLLEIGGTFCCLSNIRMRLNTDKNIEHIRLETSCIRELGLVAMRS